jgi:uncharacterized protein YdeI (YjbR/CyaY-like superfamily)
MEREVEEEEEELEEEEEQGWVVLDHKPKEEVEKMKGRGKLETIQRVQVTTRAGLRAWLEAHHLTSPGIWLVTFKKNQPKKKTATTETEDEEDTTNNHHLPYADAVEELLCFGWVDGRASRLDAARSMLHVSPRKPTSVWSGLNKTRVAALEAAGLMAPRGREVVAVAQANGQWDALKQVEALVVPTDLAKALAARGPVARRHWDAFPPSARKAALQWIEQAKRSETRRKRVDETARLAERNQRANQWVPKQ